MVKSEITGKEYNPRDMVRILNICQVTFYIQKGMKLYDMYVSSDYKTGKPLMVFMFNREETRDCFREWRDRPEQERLDSEE